MSQIRISKENYLYNLEKITEKVGSKDKIIAVLKDNAYSHGSVLLGKIASEYGINSCAVKDEREALELENLFENILILSHIPNGNESNKFIYTINDISSLKKMKNGIKIHLGIDTLMHRNGIMPDEIDEAFEIILKKNMIFLGAFTHFRSSDVLNADYFIQKQRFEDAKKKINKICSKLNFSKITFHSHNSAAFERYSELSDDCIRIGIAQLGYNQFNDNIKLKPVLSLWARRVSQRVLKAGCSVGYGAKFIAKSDMKIATYNLGYADGLFRYSGNGTLCIKNGKPLLGTMSMDSFSLEDCGEWVCIFDDVREWAKFFNTIEYEIFTKLSPYLERVVI